MCVCMVVVYRAEGIYPSSPNEDFWPFQEYFKIKGFYPGLARQGKEWQTARRKMQHDILSPKSAASYIRTNVT